MGVLSSSCSSSSSRSSSSSSDRLRGRGYGEEQGRRLLLVRDAKISVKWVEEELELETRFTFTICTIRCGSNSYSDFEVVPVVKYSKIRC
mmetsp:Transcript_15064/g.25105  ORF Transcript_15064/g.25105 Transcript_15064/m.25105 type:complete len:90 (+) Transcript_15064:1918-2187(+)